MSGTREKALANLAVAHGRRRADHAKASEIASNAAKARQAMLSDEQRKEIGRRLAEARARRSPERQQEVNAAISRGMRKS